jgi:hypothetical protein
MGWGSTGDRLSNLELDFATREDAELYCQRMGILNIYQLLNKLN